MSQTVSFQVHKVVVFSIIIFQKLGIFKFSVGNLWPGMNRAKPIS